MILVSLYFLSQFYWFFLDSVLNKPLLAKQLPGYLSYFVTGIILFLNFKFVLEHKIKIVVIAIMLLLLPSFIDLNMNLFYPFAFGTVIVITAFSLPFLNNFGKYGDFTYGMYIYHFPIIQIFKQYNLFEKNNPTIMAISVLFITFSFAVFSWFVIERRFLDRFKQSLVTV